MGSRNWQEHWNSQNDAGHRHTSERWLEFYTMELMLYAPAQISNALELGCGNGDLYGYLRRCCASYIGVDFSTAMLSKFRARFPDVQLVCADVSWLPLASNQYDFIFSRQVCQYLDQEMFKRNLEQVWQLLNSEGVYLIADIPDAQLRFFYHSAALLRDRKANWLRGIRHVASLWVRRKPDDLGKWYSRFDLCRLAHECGFTCETFSAASYEYRFHALLGKRQGHGRL